ncbi:MAG: hypothetical protein M3R55_17885 [Acidobacteriota bacterium]|nr:hypothetical protein [Acidobacteriota bacterium]
MPIPACARGGSSRTAGRLLLGALTLAGCSPPEAQRANPAIRPATISGRGWVVTRRYSANRALIVNIECRDREQAVAVARSIVDPVKELYAEALVYVRPPGGAGWTRRVQWTSATGYKVLDY